MRRRKRRILFESLAHRCMLSVNAEIFADINLAEESSLRESAEWVEMDGLLYFAADDGLHGTELWRTDGTDEGTEMVADINASLASSFPTGLTVFRDELYFAATDEDRGDELWKTDGTDAGTELVMDINEGPESSFPQYLTVFEEKLFFSAATELDGVELWATDGLGHTELFADIAEGEAGSFPQELYVFHDELYFGAATLDDGPELFKSDGTEPGTVLVKDIHVGDGLSPSYPGEFFEFQGELYFTAGDAINPEGFVDAHLFRTDGTEDGTVRVTAVETTFNFDGSANVVEFQDYLYYGGISTTSAWELYRTDGSLENSELVFDFAGAFSGSPAALTVYDDMLYFAANDVLGRQLWRSNGIPGAGNTERVTEVENANRGLFPSELKVFQDRLFWNGHDGSNWQVWASDGTSFETITNFQPNENSQFASLFFEFDDRLFFRGADADTGLELWSITVVEPAFVEGDVDGNGQVEFADFLLVSANFGNADARRADGDLDGNGVVEFADFLILSANFGQ